MDCIFVCTRHLIMHFISNTDGMYWCWRLQADFDSHWLVVDSGSLLLQCYDDSNQEYWWKPIYLDCTQGRRRLIYYGRIALDVHEIRQPSGSQGVLVSQTSNAITLGEVPSPTPPMARRHRRLALTRLGRNPFYSSRTYRKQMSKLHCLVYSFHVIYNIAQHCL